MKPKSKTRLPYERRPGEGSQDLRIIGGRLRGSKLKYHGDATVRPMKHRVREAIFNLVSTESQGRHALDLFAGTGALGLEAISRGAHSATFVEKHVPSARMVAENIDSLGVSEQCTLQVTSAFLWAKRDLPDFRPGTSKRDSQQSSLAPLPWLVFCSPPYAFYIDRRKEMMELLTRILEHAPSASTIVAEADERFDFSHLPGDSWKRREYLPAVIGIWRSDR